MICGCGNSGIQRPRGKMVPSATAARYPQQPACETRLDSGMADQSHSEGRDRFSVLFPAQLFHHQGRRICRVGARPAGSPGLEVLTPFTAAIVQLCLSVWPSSVMRVLILAHTATGRISGLNGETADAEID